MKAAVWAILAKSQFRRRLLPTPVSDPAASKPRSVSRDGQLHPNDPRVAAREAVRDGRSFFQRMVEFINPGPDSKEELMETLAEAEDNDVIGAESRVMLEGVLRLAELSAKDVMVAAPRMDVLNIDAPFDELLHSVIDTAHSRFPVFEGDKENVIGILMAKDLLKLQRAPELNLRALLRPAVFIPESKGLNDLLREFRGNRNHLAVVVDEFGRTAGLVTIEDVLEQIVGEIEDEFDVDEDLGDVFGLSDRTYRVSGDASIERLNEVFGTGLSDTVGDIRFETVGGLVSHHMGHVPRRGETHTLGELNFVVLHTKSGAVKWFKVASSPAKLP